MPPAAKSLEPTGRACFAPIGSNVSGALRRRSAHLDVKACRLIGWLAECALPALLLANPGRRQTRAVVATGESR